MEIDTYDDERTDRGRTTWGRWPGDGLFGDVRSMMRTEGWLPFGDRSGMDLRETDEGYVLAMDAPGFDRGDFSIVYDDGTLEITAESERESEFDARRPRIERMIPVPADVDADEATATYRNGVLRVRLPTPDAEFEGRRIDVE